MPRKADGNERTGKRKETIKRRQENLKKKFLEKIQETPVVQVAAAKTGIDRTTYYRWRDEDSEFKKESEKALEKGVDFINDMMESILIKNAKNDKLTAVIFWLKNHSPQYNDKRYYEHEHHIRQDDVLTDERKKEIALCMQTWSEPEDGDERDEDYELPNEELDKPEIKIKKAKVKKVPEVKKVKKKPEVKTGVAKKIVPKKLK